MSKKKNTLKDLDEFLKQQAATLVTPVKLSEKFETEVTEEIKPEPAPVAEAPAPPAPKKETQAPKEIEQPQPVKAEAHVSPEKVLNDLQALAKREGPQFRNKFYDLIIKSVESQNQFSPEDKMLINTALYLKSGERWKEAIREYWRKRN
jgi:hypothetical protein